MGLKEIILKIKNNNNILLVRKAMILLYSTHHEIKNTPLVLRVFLWRYVSHCNSHNF
jgi:hypothetical protein